MAVTFAFGPFPTSHLLTRDPLDLWPRKAAYMVYNHLKLKVCPQAWPRAKAFEFTEPVHSQMEHNTHREALVFEGPCLDTFRLRQILPIFIISAVCLAVLVLYVCRHGELSTWKHIPTKAVDTKRNRYRSLTQFPSICKEDMEDHQTPIPTSKIDCQNLGRFCEHKCSELASARGF